MEKSWLRDAMNLMNEVNLRFRHEDGVYVKFFQAIKLYGDGKVDMGFLRNKVGALFEGHRDLLDWFSIFASDPIVKEEEEKEKSTASIFEAIEKHGLKDAYDRGKLLFRKIAKVLGQSALREILVDCHLYSSGEIEKSDLSLLAADILQCHPWLLEEFDGFLGGTKKRKRLEESDCLYVKPDFSKCQRVTHSYYVLPTKDQMPHLEQEDPLLNNCLRISGNFSESGDSSQGRTKSEEEKLRDDYEDKKYELDMLVASMASTREAAEKLIMNSENPIRVGGEGLSAMHLRCIENLYGEQGIEFLRVLQANPRDALPVIVRRLQQKLEEVKEWARCFTFNKYSQGIKFQL